MEILLEKIFEDVKIPSKANNIDAGYDLYSTEEIALLPGQRALIGTGIKIKIPEGYYGRIVPRSGLALKNGIDVLAGVIDSGYAGEVKVILMNLTYEQERSIFHVKKDMRIAQLIIEKCHNVDFKIVNSLEKTSRSEKGFGSSGT